MHYTRVHAKYPTWEAHIIMQQQSQFRLARYYEYLLKTEVLQMLEMLDASKMPLM